MGLTRTITMMPPPPSPGRRWIAWALLEAPDEGGVAGEFHAIEAGEDPKAGPVTTRYAEHDPGWYVIQFHDDRQTSVFSDPVLLTGPFASA